MLPGRNAAGTPICRDCAGITTALTCDRCGTEAERFRGGVCVRCVLRDDLGELLQPTTPPDLRLKRLIEVLAATERPESIYTWMRGADAHHLLALLGTRELALTHHAFDALPASRALTHLREMLVHHRILPERDGELAIFERWIEDRLATFAHRPQIRDPLGRFALWHHLGRLRQRSGPGVDLNYAIRSAKQEITETGRFLAWLADEHSSAATDIRQAQIDTWLADGPSTRQRIRTFIVWMIDGRQIRHVTAPHRMAKTSPMLDQPARMQHVRRCLEDTGMPVGDRLATLILLLYAHPVGDIAALRTQAIETKPDGLYLRLGTTPVRMPAPMATIAWEHLQARPNQQTTNSGTSWLFPGSLAGHHISPESMLKRLRGWGVDLGAARNAALRELVMQLTPAALVKQLGYSPQVISKHATDSAAPQANYPSLKQDQLETGPSNVVTAQHP
ncbi:site-specific recombinase [Microbacteriaceae bacterium VKM Ac-2855]|nr:site-specific recombinase [Microbacteriaceae bacterium VKM Ac-2855]